MATWRHDDALPASIEEAILNKGPEAFKALDAGILASLALNYVALFRLSNRIASTMPGAWHDVIAAHGKRTMQQKGVNLDRLLESVLEEKSVRGRASATVLGEPPRTLRLLAHWWRSPQMVIAGALAASILFALGAIVGSLAFRERTGVLVASAMPSYHDVRGNERELRIEIKSELSGFATIVALAPGPRPEVFPGPGGDDIPVKAATSVESGPLPLATTRVVLVVTETPAAEPIRKALAKKTFTPDQMEELRQFLQSTLEAKGYRRMAFGVARPTPPTRQ
jgi:hypothetical protein